jgi:hypothetical protein
MNPRPRRLAVRPAWLSLLAVTLATTAACSEPPSVPEHPTWADVAPIVHGECASCHGPTANDTGGGYRLDFYDMTPAVCGDAAQGLGGAAILAGTSAPLIKVDVTSPGGGTRARMPPAPAPGLFDWERLTLDRWADQPSKGAPSATNRVPTIDVQRVPAMVNGHLSFTAVVADPDGDPVVGVLEIAGAVYGMNRPGAFDVELDASTWAAGTQRLSAVLCDGWTNVRYDLGPVRVTH